MENCFYSKVVVVVVVVAVGSSGDGGGGSGSGGGWGDDSGASSSRYYYHYWIRIRLTLVQPGLYPSASYRQLYFGMCKSVSEPPKRVGGSLMTCAF